ncbi:hypothetical protein L0F51_01025 [Afifella sp. H1R]|uniref:hypothetical protein n=1 Tax=Afifella sp. H1R TaxID=2908841 RepID=UPI001F23D54B|nr:hypothetical protein [Afifella sp. H1R]MCF1502346.1 hypothetical protein [Afifella sp. H1R]
MSKSLMWTAKDARGLTVQCLFNEDARSYEMTVSGQSAWTCRSETFLASSEPVFGMDPDDRALSVQVADRLMHDVARALGDF